MVTVAVRGHLM